MSRASREMRCEGLIISKELSTVTVTFAEHQSSVCFSDSGASLATTGTMQAPCLQNYKWLNETLKLVPVTETKNYKY